MLTHRHPLHPLGRRPLALCALFVLVAWLGAASRARAEGEPDDSTRAAARALGTQGIEAYWANDYQTAHTKLDRAYRLYPTSTLGLWSARARVQLGQLVAGAERFREALRAASLGDSEAQQKAQSEARAELDKLTPRIPTLTVHVLNARPEDVTVTLDSVAIPSALLDEGRPTDPGKHIVVASRGASGGERQQIEVQLREGEQRQLTVRFNQQEYQASEPVSGSGEGLALSPRAAAAQAQQPAARADRRATSSSPLRPLGIIVLSFGGAGLATAAVTALIANSKRDNCDLDVCAPDIKQSYDAMRLIDRGVLRGGRAGGRGLGDVPRGAQRRRRAELAARPGQRRCQRQVLTAQRAAQAQPGGSSRSATRCDRARDSNDALTVRAAARAQPGDSD